MAYLDLADLAVDDDFLRRVAACAAEQEVGGADLGGQSPSSWAMLRQWRMAASPGFADAYAYAKGTGVQNPGADPTVITDEQILSAVQANLTT